MDEQFGHRCSGTSNIPSDGAGPPFQAPSGEHNIITILASLATDLICACSKQDSRGRASIGFACRGLSSTGDSQLVSFSLAHRPFTTSVRALYCARKKYDRTR
jgi:hypothetical protein